MTGTSRVMRDAEVTDDGDSIIVEMETMMASQTMAPAFLYYTPEPNPQNRQQGHFIPHPHPHHHQHQHQHQQPHPQPFPHAHAMHRHQIVFPVVPTLPSTPMYSRPNSSCSQPQMPPKAFTLPSNMTPLASPQPMAHKPTIMLDTDLNEADGLYYPSTPPLSSSGSAISSPGSCDMLQTPLNPMFSGLDGIEGKAVCEADSLPESFPTLDWTTCASPPMTPGRFFFFAFV